MIPINKKRNGCGFWANIEVECRNAKDNFILEDFSTSFEKNKEKIKRERSPTPST